MPIVLYRVDERLIHGQVVIGWGLDLRLQRYVLVDDDIALDDWEQELYRLAAGDADVLFATATEARERLGEWREEPARTIVLTRDIGTMRRLADGGRMVGEEVNLGGLHHAPGRKELLPYLFVSDEDREDLRKLGASGVSVSARELPDSHRVSLATLLDT